MPFFVPLVLASPFKLAGQCVLVHAVDVPKAVLFPDALAIMYCRVHDLLHALVRSPHDHLSSSFCYSAREPMIFFLDNGKIIRLHPPRQGGIRPTLLQAVATTPNSYNIIKV